MRQLEVLRRLRLGNRDFGFGGANIVKAGVASARYVRGEPLFIRDWDDEFIDVPEVDEQNQPTVDRDEMTAILQEAEEPYYTLYGITIWLGRIKD